MWDSLSQFVTHKLYSAGNDSFQGKEKTLVAFIQEICLDYSPLSKDRRMGRQDNLSGQEVCCNRWKLGNLSCLWMTTSGCLLSPFCPGLFAEAGAKPVCRGQWFVSREGFQAFFGAVCRRAERGRLCSLWWGDHPKGAPVQAACQQSCLLLCHGECLPKLPLRSKEEKIMSAVLCNWNRCQAGVSVGFIHSLYQQWRRWWHRKFWCLPTIALRPSSTSRRRVWGRVGQV